MRDTRVVSTKLPRKAYGAMKRRAFALGLKPGEWLRHVIFGSLANALQPIKYSISLSEGHQTSLAVGGAGKPAPTTKNEAGFWGSPRMTVEYRRWRLKVLKRDGCECRRCGSKENLEVHHVLPFSNFKNHRFIVENGRTLCVECHAYIHTGEPGGGLVQGKADNVARRREIQAEEAEEDRKP